MKNKSPIIIYAGTFNPVHYGHVQVARSVQAKHQRLGFQTPGCILFLPVARSMLPKHPLPLEHRVAMVNIAITDMHGVELLNLDHKKTLPRTHYERFLQMEREGIFPNYWIIGSDTYTSEVLRVFEFDRLMKAGVGLIISQRKDYEIKDISKGSDTSDIPYANENWFKKSTYVLPVPRRFNDISSTAIRRDFANLNGYDHLLPVRVVDYLNTHRLHESFI